MKYFSASTITIQCLAVSVLLLLLSCTTVHLPESKAVEGRNLFAEAQKAFEVRDYPDAINLFQEYLKNFPNTKTYTIALQRLGESCEGLLEMEYQRRVERGEPELKVREAFLKKFGHVDCWEKGSGRLAYNKIHYKTLLEKYPDSPIADEAAYRMIVWEQDYKGRPEGVLRELRALEEILEKYSTTSLRPMILYQMAHRCHILYEIYSFSPRPAIHNPLKAQEYKEKALYLYQLALKSPEHTKYSDQAWKDMDALQQGKRTYLFE